MDSRFRGNDEPVDMGVIHQIGETGFSASFALMNLGGELKFKDSGDPLPLTAKPGVAYRTGLGRMGKLTAALDSDYLLYDGFGTVQTGLEWQVHSVVALRAGYQFGRADYAGSGFAAGLGLKVANWGIDYAFVPYGDLGDTHRLALGLKF